MTSESEDKIMSTGGVDSPAAEETSDKENIGSSTQLKKGPWTTAEDKILVEYVTKNGEGNWNAVQKHTGLARCGKSCRLRWANHLRPDLKKGAFSEAEERRIIELHAKMGNKWARMATELPGRTDNEIKNFWNTRIKRQQRAGLPIYPPDICLQAGNVNQQSDAMDNFSSGNAQQSEFSPFNFEIPSFKNLELTQQLYESALHDIPPSNLAENPANGILAQGLDSMHPPKRLRGSEPVFPGLSPGFDGVVLPACNQYQVNGSEQFGYSSAYDQTLVPEHPSSSRLFPGSHALSNGNLSSSEPTMVKLPSIQTQAGNWESPSSPLPSLDSVDTLIQSPPTEYTGSGSLSPRNNGLLESVLYESKTIKTMNNLCQPTKASIIPWDLMDNSSPYLHEIEWEGYGDPTSPLGRTANSVFNAHTPFGVGSSGEGQSLNTIPGDKFTQAAVNVAQTQSFGKSELNEVIYPFRKNGRESSLQTEICNWGTFW